jgi:hypothetical protein
VFSIQIAPRKSWKAQFSQLYSKLPQVQTLSLGKYRPSPVSKCKARSLGPKWAHTLSDYRPYLTSVRKDASSHLVVSFILLKSPSQIRGIKPESPCNGKKECHCCHVKWNQLTTEFGFFWSRLRLKGPACQSWTLNPSGTTSYSMKLLGNTWLIN